MRFKCTCMSVILYTQLLRVIQLLLGCFAKKLIYAQWFIWSLRDFLKKFPIHLSIYLSIYQMYKCDWVSVLWWFLSLVFVFFSFDFLSVSILSVVSFFSCAFIHCSQFVSVYRKFFTISAVHSASFTRYNCTVFLLAVIK